VVTDGADGAHASLLGQTITVPAPAVTLVDTVGAGDAFTAGLLHALRGVGALGGRMASLAIGELTDAMRFASMVAGLTCERTGANPPWAYEL
jgi:fructokinase